MPVAVVASEHVRANVNPQDLLLKASAAPQAIIQQMPSIPSLQPGVIHRLFNKTTKSAGEKFTNMQQPVPPEIQEEIAPVQTEPAPPVKTEKAPVIAETHDTDIQLPSAPAIPAKKSPVIETFSASSCGDYKAPQNIERLLRDVTKGDRNVSYEVMHCLLGSESGFKNVKSHSGAVGIGQWTEGPFLERLLKIKKFLSDDERKIANNVQSHWVKPKGEKPYLVFEGKGKTPEQKSANRAAALALRTNDRVALIATREDIRAKIDEAKEEYRHSIKVTLNWLENTSEGRVQKDRIKHLKEQLRRPWTVTDVKIVYFAGVRGGVQLLAAYADPARHEDEAGKHTASIVVTNNDSVFVDHGRSRTVAQFMDYMEDRVGSEALPGEAVSNNAEEFAFNAR